MELYAIIIDDEAVIIYDQSIVEMLEGGMDIEDLAKAFMVSEDDVKKVLMS